MIDIHCHILPGIDDGAQTIEDSLEMARRAVQEGITAIIATPHHNKAGYVNPKEEIVRKCKELNDILQSENLPLEILPGQEPAIGGELIEDFENKRLQTLNGTQYLFVEMPSSQVPRYTERLLFDLQLKGIVPIIVHPERNRELLENPELLYQLVKKGALTQLTAGSLTGRFGKKIRTFSFDILNSNLVHLIASDAHNITTRAFHLQAAYEEIKKTYGTDMQYLFMENAELLVEGQNIYKEMPQRVKKKKFLGIF
ncbi:tyrosine protein phosphatase [Mesobacillus campisalis]|uniref:Tyrosine-protein phosphatase n=1 Tax=Mesobacillus campisalis TaxID=1408103 RepID=A0A0M2SWF5_9BACI|nr:CpsB/CapC family capsule biosynthesis tyrosine phosphatase [Mesobacillus campisalis]KKK38889.1 tyrosine protein phosphatase [Mesobacillus campisalis]